MHIKAMVAKNIKMPFCEPVITNSGARRGPKIEPIPFTKIIDWVAAIILSDSTASHKILRLNG